MPRSQLPDRFIRFLWLASPIFIALMLYGHALHLPFYLDDAPNFWFVENNDLLSHWAGDEAFPFYRPFIFTLWKASTIIASGYDALALHAFNILVFGLTASIISALVMRVLALWGWARSQQRLAAFVAGMIYVMFPFAYKTVPLISSAFHIVMVFGVVLALWAMLRFVKSGHYGWWVVALLGTFISAFSHENGFLGALFALPLLGLIRPFRWRRTLIAWLPLAFISAIYLLLWATVPRQQSPDGLLLSYDIPTNFAFLMQGFAPFSASLARFFVANPASPLVVCLLIFGVALVALLLLQRSNILLGLGAISWYIIAIIPATLLLFPAYVLDSPRLMLLSSVATALFWGMLFAQQWQAGRIRRIFVVLIMGYAGLSALQFHSARQNDFARLNAYHQELLSLVPQYTDGLPPILVNSANALAPLRDDRMFLMGSDGVFFMVDELDYGQYFWANTGLYVAVDFLVDAITLRAESEFYNPADYATWERATPDEVRTRLLSGAPIMPTLFSSDNTFIPYYAGAAGLIPPIETMMASFAPPDTDIAIILTNAQVDKALESNTLIVMLDWQVRTPLPAKRFIHVFCNGDFIAQSDGYIWGDMYPFNVWQSGDRQREYRIIPLEEPYQQDCLEIRVGVYDEITGMRFLALDENNSQLDDDSLRLIIQ